MLTLFGHFVFYYLPGHSMVYKGQDSTSQLLWGPHLSLSHPTWILPGRGNVCPIQHLASNGIIIIVAMCLFLSDFLVLTEFFHACPLVVNQINLAYSVEIRMVAG